MEKKYSISNEFKERTYNFALKILELARNLPDIEEGKILRRQIIRSGTSIGANLEEADGSLSLNDFVYKVDVAFKEARETRYWLQLIKDSKILSQKFLEATLQECIEIMKIFSTIIFRILRKKNI